MATGFIGPFIEELYFRGFLLPRMAWMKKWALLVEAFLFALYHIWSPWQLVTRFFGSPSTGLYCKVEYEPAHWCRNTLVVEFNRQFIITLCGLLMEKLVENLKNS